MQSPLLSRCHTGSSLYTGRQKHRTRNTDPAARCECLTRQIDKSLVVSLVHDVNHQCPVRRHIPLIHYQGIVPTPRFERNGPLGWKHSWLHGNSQSSLHGSLASSSCIWSACWSVLVTVIYVKQGATSSPII